jgi:hypothetical protein
MPLLKEQSTKSGSSVALLLIDVINDLDFDQADELLVQALPMAAKIAGFKRKAANLQIPTIYVNDNFGQWKSDFWQTVDHCCAGNSRGREIPRALRPAPLRLFRSEAQTLGLLCHDSRSSVGISENRYADHHRNRSKHLRAVHCERCLYAGLPVDCTCRLCRV